MPPEHVGEVVPHCEAVVVRSAIVKRIAENAGRADFLERIADFVKPPAAATKRG
jgi:tryptophan synthase alpha subunit